MQNNLLTKIPAFKMLIIILAGIAIGGLVNWNSELIFLLLFFGLILVIVLIKLNYNLSVYFLTLLLAGFWISSQISDIKISVPEKTIPQFPAMFEGSIEKINNQDANYMRFIAEGTMKAQPLPEIKKVRIMISVTKIENLKFALTPGTKFYSILNVRPPKYQQLPTDFPEAQYAMTNDVKWLGRTTGHKISFISRTKTIGYYQGQITNSIKNAITALYPENIKPIINALILGDQSKIDPETRKTYSLAGTAHVLSVSGLHTGIIAGIIFLFLGFVKSRWLKFTLFSIAIFGFVIVTGSQPPALRAAAMAVLALLAHTLQRRIDMLNIISLALIFIIIISPELIYSASFQMSTASMFGLILLFKPIRQFFSWIIKSEKPYLKYFVSSISMTIAASLVVSPLVANYFSIYSVVSPLTNLFVVPLMSLAMIFSLISLILFPISINLASVYAASTSFLVNLSQWLNEISLKLPYAYIKDNNLTIIIIFSVALVVYLTFSRTYRALAFRFIMSVLIFLFLSYLFSSNEFRHQEIYPRGQMAVALIPLNGNSSFVYLQDRRPMQYPFKDRGLEKYLSESKDSIIIGITGIVSENCAEDVKKLRTVKIVEIPLESQLKIEKSIGIKNFSQVVN